MASSAILWGQNTYVPDDNFEQALIDLEYDDVLNDFVLTENISGVTSLDVGSKSISDLTGIEAFTALTSLVGSGNQLTSLDVSSNTLLTSLTLNNNYTITSLDVSTNLNLEYLGCNYNQLTSLDLSSNTNLTTLECTDNQLTNLNVSSNTALIRLKCFVNSLTSLDVSTITALTYLEVQDNQLTSLDVSANTALTELNCNTNQLIHLNMKNGVTDQLNQFEATNNPSLGCIEVNADDIAYATANWTYANGNIDEGVDFSVVCAPEGYTYVPDDNFEQALIDLGYDDVLNDFVLTENISGVTTLDVNVKEISDLTGIEDFTALTNLQCGSNSLTSLDVSANTALTYLECNGNQLTSLDVSNNTELTTLKCYNNELTSLDVSSNTALI